MQQLSTIVSLITPTPTPSITITPGIIIPPLSFSSKRVGYIPKIERMFQKQKSKFEKYGFGWSSWWNIERGSHILTGQKATHFKLTPSGKKMFVSEFKKRGLFIAMPTQEQIRGKRYEITTFVKNVFGKKKKRKFI